MPRYLNWSESFLAMEEVKGSSPFRCSSLQDWQRSYAPPFQGGLRRCEFGILLHFEARPECVGPEVQWVQGLASNGRRFGCSFHIGHEGPPKKGRTRLQVLSSSATTDRRESYLQAQVQPKGSVRRNTGKGAYAFLVAYEVPIQYLVWYKSNTSRHFSICET